MPKLSGRAAKVSRESTLCACGDRKYSGRKNFFPRRSKPPRYQEDGHFPPFREGTIRFLLLMPYLLDSNVFIEAKNKYYQFSLCPGFWDWLIRENANGKIFSHDSVLSELARFGDDLSQWAGSRGQ